jgi:hypothetical protein
MLVACVDNTYIYKYKCNNNMKRATKRNPIPSVPPQQAKSFATTGNFLPIHTDARQGDRSAPIFPYIYGLFSICDATERESEKTEDRAGRRRKHRALDRTTVRRQPVEQKIQRMGAPPPRQPDNPHHKRSTDTNTTIWLLSQLKK